MELKVGDKVEIIGDCNCVYNNQKGMTGVISYIGPASYLIDMSKHREETRADSWYHYRECLRLVNKGFNPDKIISEAFGGVK